MAPDTRYDGGMVRFEGLDAKRLAKLIAKGFADPAGRQNDSPTAARFLEFMKREPRARAHGYVVSPRRADCRVSVEGLTLTFQSTDTPEERKAIARAFDEFCHGADELGAEDDGSLRSWWD